MNNVERLRALPAVDEVLRSDALSDLRETQPAPQLTQWVREAIAKCRQRLINEDSFEPESMLDSIVDEVRQKQQSARGQSIQRVINATGIVLHTNLGRAPLADRAIERIQDASRYANVELNLSSGRRSHRGDRACQLLAMLVDAEDALVVNNCAAATILTLQAIARGREVIVSRGQLVEIGGGFRLPDVFRTSGVVLREVGTTNRTYLRDYESAMGENTGALIRVHRSNFELTGFVTEPTIDEMVTIRPDDSIPVIDDIGSGCIGDLSMLGLSEPNVLHSVRSGADLTLFSGDKLFGGPQCGIVVGRSKWISLLRKHPMMRALRVDKLILAALEATVEIHLEGKAANELPTLRSLHTSLEDIQGRCQQLYDQLSGSCDVQIISCQSQVGGGSVPGAVLESRGLKIGGAISPDHLARALREGTPAVQPRVTDDSVVLDMRTVSDHEMAVLGQRLAAAIQKVRRQESDA